MSNSSKHWLPAGESLSPGQQWALAVPERTSGPMTQEQHRLRLETKLRLAAEAVPSPRELKQVLRMSEETLPEVWALAHESLAPDQLAGALMESESLNALLNLIEWDQPGTLKPSPEEPPNLREILEQLP